MSKTVSGNLHAAMMSLCASSTFALLRQPTKHAERDAGECKREPAARHQSQHVAGLSAERQTDAELARALRDRVVPLAA